MVKYVDIESPYFSPYEGEVARNIRYARACVNDSLARGEAPYASHLFFTQPEILDDNIPEERKRGVEIGKSIVMMLGAVTAVYTDLGISDGMKLGIEGAERAGRDIEYRTLGKNWEGKSLKQESRHSQRGAWSVV